MYKKNRLAVALVLSLSAVIPRLADASNGYFDYGHGTKNKGMAGAGIALPQDAMAAATNPAGMVFVGDRVDFGFEGINQLASYKDTLGGAIVADDISAKQNLVNLHLGYNGMLDPLSSIGVTSYGNGRAATNYSGSDSIDLEQRITNLSYAHRFGKYTSLGIGFLIGSQALNITDSVNGKGPTDAALGFGWIVGFQTGWEHFIVAGSYQTKVVMSEFTKYTLDIAENGKLDIPSTYTLGVAFPFKNFAAVIDYQRINYAGVPALGNSSLLPVDSGFGWKNVSVLKLGTQFKMGGTELRLGISHATPPIDETNMDAGPAMPYVVENHVSFGITQRLNEDLDLSMAYTHGLKNTVTGILSTGETEELSLYQNSLEFSLAVKF
jgi:long-chain fatty acid transport protein